MAAADPGLNREGKSVLKTRHRRDPPVLVSQRDHGPQTVEITTGPLT